MDKAAICEAVLPLRLGPQRWTKKVRSPNRCIKGAAKDAAIANRAPMNARRGRIASLHAATVPLPANELVSSQTESSLRSREELNPGRNDPSGCQPKEGVPLRTGK